uniref:Uncharacterized protein n=1 Tax=Rhodnius prolixus TaxID=13249 RepID=T1IAT8_RHOPR
MPSDRERTSSASSGALSNPAIGAVDSSSVIISKLDSLASDIAASRREQASLSAEIKDLKNDLKKVSEKLAKELQICKRKISRLMEENKKIKEQIISLNREISFSSQTPFLFNVKIDNYPVAVDENLFLIVKKISESIGMEIREEMIDYIYRRNFGKKTVPSIIIKFLHVSVKTKFIINAKRNKDRLYPEDPSRNIYVNELLSSFNYKLFTMAIDYKRQGFVESAWHRNGVILIKKKANERPKAIRCKEDLQALNPAISAIFSSDDEDLDPPLESDASTSSVGSKRRRGEHKLGRSPSITSFLSRKHK